MDPQWVGTVTLVALALGVGGVIAVWVLSSRQQRFFQSLQRDTSWPGGVRALYDPGSRHRAAAFRLQALAPVDSSFRVARERTGDVLLKGVGFASEAQTGDPEFDKTYYIDSDFPEFVSALFARPEARQAVSNLFGFGCMSLILRDRDLTAVWDPNGSRREAALFRAAALDLIHLTRLMASAEQDAPAPAAGETEQAFDSSVGLVTVAGCVVSGLVFFFHRHLPGRLLVADEAFLASLKWSLPAAAALAAAFAMRARGKSWAGRALGAAALAGLATCPVGGYLAFRWVNCALDFSKPETFQTRVGRKRRESGRHGTSYYVDLESWRGRPMEEFEVGWLAFDRYEEGRPVTVVTKPGRLGYEWLVSNDAGL